MKTDDNAPVTLRQLAERILALPPEQQDKPAWYHMVDDRGHEMHERVFGIEIDGDGDAVLEGADHYS